MDRVAKGHCEGEGAGGGTHPSCTEREADTTPFHKTNGKLKRGPCTCSCCVALSIEKKISFFRSGGGGGGGGGRPSPCPPPLNTALSASVN